MHQLGRLRLFLDHGHGQLALTLKATLCIVVFALIHDRRRDADIAGKYELDQELIQLLVTFACKPLEVDL